MSPPSAASPTSCWASSVTSRAILPSTPARMPQSGGQRDGTHAGSPARAAPARPARARRPRAPPPPVPGPRPGRPSAPPARPSRTSASRRARRVQSRQPAGGAQPERDRQRLLEQRAPDHRRVAVRLGQRSGRVGGGRARRPAAGRAPGGRSASAPCRRCPGWWRRGARARRAGSADRRAQRLDQRHHRGGVSAASRPSAAMSKRSARHAAAISSAAQARDQALGGAGPSQRRLDVEHRLQPGAVAQLRGGRAARVDAAEQPGSDVKEDRLARSLEADVEAVAAVRRAVAISVWRRSAGTRARIGSCGVGLLLVAEVDPGHARG